MESTGNITTFHVTAVSLKDVLSMAQKIVKESQDEIKEIILDCFKNNKLKQIDALFDLLTYKPITDPVWSKWFDLERDQSKPRLLTYKLRVHMLQHFFTAVYSLVKEKDQEKKPKSEDLLPFLLKSKLSVLVTSIFEDNSSSSSDIYKRVENDTVQYMALLMMKEIIEFSGHMQTPSSNVLLKRSSVEILIDIIRSSHRDMCTIVAVDVLCCLSLGHREACERIMKYNGHLILANLIKKDEAQKILITAGLTEDVFNCDGSLPKYKFHNFDTCVDVAVNDWKLPVIINRERGIQLLQTGFEIKKTAMKIIMLIADMNNRYRLMLYNNEQCMKAILSWLSNPSLGPSTHIMYQFSSHIISNMLLSEEVATKLIHDHSIIDVLDNGLTSAGWHISRQFQMVIIGIAKHGGEVRNMLATNTNIFEVLVCQMYSIDEEVQPAVIGLISELAQGRKTANELHKAGCTPQLLMDTGHFYGHSYRRHIERAREGFVKYVRSWRREENQVKIRDQEGDDMEIRNEVEEKKQLGNAEFKQEDYHTALKYYSDALEICPIRIICPDGDQCPSWNPHLGKGENVYHWWVLPATLFANRAFCYLKMSKWKECIEDCTKAICSCWIPSDEGGPERKSIFLKSVYRRARAWYELKEYHKALNDASCCFELSPDDTAITLLYKECVLLYRKFCRREQIRHCGNCGAGEGISLRRCANCCEVYCSKECQMTDWDAGHKDLCEKVSKRSR